MIKQLQYRIPELYFLLMTMLYWRDSIWLNPIAIISFVWLIFVLFKQKRELGLVYGITILILTVYLLFAFLSDFHKITIFDEKAKKFISYGLLLFASNFIMSILLIYKNTDDFVFKKINIESGK